jgi:hypothetical protein
MLFLKMTDIISRLLNIVTVPESNALQQLSLYAHFKEGFEGFCRSLLLQKNRCLLQRVNMN